MKGTENIFISIVYSMMMNKSTDDANSMHQIQCYIITKEKLN